MDRTTGERLAAIEEILLRVEQQLLAHITDDARRLSRLEWAWAYAAGACSLVVLGLGAYLKAFFKH